MSVETIVNDLRVSALSTDLGGEELQAFARIVDERRLSDGEVLVGEGTRDDRLYIVSEGRLAVTRRAEIGGGNTIAILGPGDLAGELAFIDGSERHSSLVAIGPTRVLGVSKGTLEAEVDRNPRLVWHVLCAIIRRAHEVQRRLSLQALELSNYVFKQHGRY